MICHLASWDFLLYILTCAFFYEYIWLKLLLLLLLFPMLLVNYLIYIYVFFIFYFFFLVGIMNRNSITFTYVNTDMLYIVICFFFLYKYIFIMQSKLNYLIFSHRVRPYECCSFDWWGLDVWTLKGIFLFYYLRCRKGPQVRKLFSDYWSCSTGLLISS